MSKDKNLQLVYRSPERISTVVEVSGVRIGAGEKILMAGPCAVESYEQLKTIALEVKARGAKILRGGAFKPRTYPYSFQGLQTEGLHILQQISQEVGIPVVSEILSIDHLQDFARLVDLIQIGARNMQNFDLLVQVARLNKPILLKRGMGATYQEFLAAAEYILKEGNTQLILCERGIRTFETSTRYTLDLNTVALLKKETHLPVLVDPSHAAGRSDLVEPLALAGLAAGADGLLVEVHQHPEQALCDGVQSLNFNQFDSLTRHL